MCDDGAEAGLLVQPGLIDILLYGVNLRFDDFNDVCFCCRFCLDYFLFLCHYKLNRESTPKAENTTPKGQNPTPKTENTTPKKIGEKAQAVIDILIEDPFIKREELAVRLGLTLEGVKYHLGQLQKKGYVLRDDGRKNGKWKVLIKK